MNPEDDQLGARRRLYHRYYQWMVDENKLDPEWFVIVESLEIKVHPGTFSDINHLNLTWEMLSYEEEMIFI